MRKALNSNNLSERPAGRTLLAFSLAASLAAFGCTTNRTPGNGDPVRTAPATSPAATSGSSSGYSVPANPPMMSSSTHIDPLPSVATRAKRLPLSPDEAAAVLAGNGLNRGVRVLGPSNPAAGRAYASTGGVADGGYQDPIQKLGGIVTVNSSVNSIAHLPAIAGDGSGAVVSGTTAASTITGTSAALTAGTTATGLGSGNAVVFSPTASAATPTTAAIPVTAGSISTTASSVLSPTVSSASVTSPTVASSSLAATGTTTTTGATRTATAASTTSGKTAGTTATAASTVTAANRTASASATVAPIRVTQDSSGKVVVSNASTRKSQ